MPAPDAVPSPAQPAMSFPTGATVPRAHPALWVPSLYFAMGVPLNAVVAMSVVMYKNLGLSNAEIALYTGSLYLPWVVKPLWSPLVEMFRTKRAFVLGAQLLMAASLAAAALALTGPSAVGATLALLWVVAFAAATQDVAADGVYISALDAREQAVWVGVQGICWNLGRVLTLGVLVTVAGALHERIDLGWPRSWSAVMALLSLTLALAFAWHGRVLPAGGAAAAAPPGIREARRAFAAVLAGFFRKEGIWAMAGLAFFYRIGEGLIEKTGPLFLLDAREAGGLGLDNVQLGTLYGTYGTAAFVAGALLGGVFTARRGLRRSLLILAAALNAPHAAYLYLSQARPESLLAIGGAVVIEKFGYGFGSVGHMLYMMQQMAPGPAPTAHYALATGIMGLCMMATGMLSGALQQAVGYGMFFALVIAVSVVPVVFAWKAPFPVRDPARSRAA